MKKKYEDIEWDFLNNKYKYTHDMHKYPAKLVPEIVEKLLEKYQTKDMKLLFEPYVGSGTTLIEANIKGLNCICTDLNPLARKISKVKTTFIELENLINEVKNFQGNSELMDKELHLDELDFNYPKITNIKYWFKEDNIKQLIPIKNYINTLDNEDVKNFFEVAFSETIREVSLTRNNEFKRYRIQKEKIPIHDIKAYPLMLIKLYKNIDKIRYYMEAGNKDKKIEIYSFNTVKEIPKEILAEESVDIIITSPPYGDSSSTVAYGEFSRFANEWLEHEDSENLDSQLMGGQRLKQEVIFDFPLLDEALERIKKQNHKRALEVMSFYLDYKKSIKNISKIVKSNGIVAYVVGNRTVKGEVLETDEITKHFFEVNGFQYLETIIRKISYKRLPSKTSPTGKSGEKIRTMNKEYIVVMKKL